MNWKIYCLLAILFFTLHDYLLKYLSKLIPPALSSLAINLFAALGIFLLLFKPIAFQMKELHRFTIHQIFFLLITGASLGIATVCLMKTFELGAAFSIAVPVVYTSMIILSVILGYLLLNEKIVWQQGIGVILSITGILLIFKYYKPL